jgi:4-amino-4-deoxy-L-arabinose transferase-like glycosyltransferase
MKPPQAALLLVLGLAAALLTAWWQRAPGYMDADYYTMMAGRIGAQGTWSEPVLWNYLDDPAGLPHPAFQYWMPLTSLLAAVPVAVLGQGFQVARLPSILLTVLLPLLAAAMAAALGAGKRLQILAGLLAVFPGFYLPFFLTTDSFALYASLGGGMMLTSLRAARGDDWRWWLLGGALVGLAQLCRADGLLLALPALWLIARSREERVRRLVALATGIIVTLGTWGALRAAQGVPALGFGSGRTLFLTSYDDLFSYPASQLGLDRWLQTGLAGILLDRLRALGSNLQALLFVNGLVFEAPLMVAGFAAVRRNGLAQGAAIYLTGLLAVMSFVFPYAGARGGFFHSSAALMPFLWATAAIGLERIVRWAGIRRGWREAPAQRSFGAGAVLIALVATSFIVATRVVGADPLKPGWNFAGRSYQVAAQHLAMHSKPSELVAVNNPPGFFLASGRQAVVIPNGTLDTLRTVAQRYGVQWVILEPNHPSGLDSLYANPGASDWLALTESWLDEHRGLVMLFRVRPEAGN